MRPNLVHYFQGETLDMKSTKDLWGKNCSNRRLRNSKRLESDKKALSHTHTVELSYY